MSSEDTLKQTETMKDFLKYVFATVVGMVIVGVLVGVIGAISIAGMVAASNSTTEVEDNSVLVLNLSGTLSERSNNDVMARVMGEKAPELGLQEILSAIDKAKANETIKGIYIEAGMFSPDAPASAQAIRDKLVDFKKSGKWIVAYSDLYTQFSYYICSVADKIYLNPQGGINWCGLAANPMFFKDVLAKFGVKMQLSKVGKYKSAPEQFTADGMSAPNREQVSVYLNGVWDKMLTDISASRKISKSSLNACADSLYMFAEQSQYLKAHFIDKLIYTDEVKVEIKKLLGVDKDDAINQLSVADMENLPAVDGGKGDEIAVYYAYGDVVDQAASGLSSGAQIVGKTVCQDLEALANDDDVKAVVLRVNSGGGSAYASEQIWHAVCKLKEKKPVVVSMGGLAASGGYYLSCAANYIYAEPTTLTGSIGIFGMFPDFSGLLTDKLGVKFDEVKTNKNSAFGTLARPFNAEEMAYLNAYIGRGYNLFLKRVADGRHMKVADVDSIAQGRVWLGNDALRIKLVDGLGGLDKAVAKAAQLAKLGDYHTEDYPERPDWIDSFFAQMSGKGNYLDEQLRLTLGEYYAPFTYLKTINKQSAIQARLPYVLVIK